MGKVLVVAEKPSAGADMAKVLGCNDRKNGYFENEQYIVTWAVGHLIGLKMPEEHDTKYKEWRMQDLPLIFEVEDSLKVLPESASQFEIVKSLINRRDVDYIINAGDAGREGYLIQSWIYRYAGNRKPVKILWASSLTEEALRKAFANLKDEDEYFVNLLQEEEKKKKAPLLFSLSELQKEMGRKFKYTPDRTLELTQSLYEKYKIVSYPRTDSCCLSMDLYNEIGEHISSCNFGKFRDIVGKINPSGIRADKSYFNDAKVTDHHALIPTINGNMEAEYKKLSEEERNVFEAIVYRFLAIFYPEYEYATTTLLTQIDNYRFRSRGITVKNLGYRELLKSDDKEEDKQEQLPMLQEGDKVAVDEVELLSKKTTPPPRYTVESIITLMEKYHIGTSATMAEIVKKLQNPKRQCIMLTKGTYYSTPFGRKFISVVPENLKSPELTKHIEEQLAQIGEGNCTKDEFLAEIVEQIRRYVESVKGDAQKLQEKEPIENCPFCGEPVIEGRFSYKCQTEECLEISKIICGKSISARMVQDLIKNKKTGTIKGFVSKKSDKTFDAKLVLNGKSIDFEFPARRR